MLRRRCLCGEARPRSGVGALGVGEEYMEPHWTTIAAFWATVVVALVTVCATIINYLLFRSQTDPEVIVYTKHDSNRSTIISLVIENIGNAVAYDIKFSFSKSIPARAFGWEPIAEDKVDWLKDGPLINGIPSLPPGGVRELDWGRYAGLRSVIGDGAISVTARFKAKKLLSPEPVYCETESKIDVESYAGTVANDTNETRKIRKELEKVEKAIKTIGTVEHPLSVSLPENKDDRVPGSR